MLPSGDSCDPPRLPFLSDADTINYVQSSKLMVLVSTDNKTVLESICRTYGSNATCISNGKASKKLAEVETACTKDQHVVGVLVGQLNHFQLSDLKPYDQLAYDHNYLVSFVGEGKRILPDYIGWHLNEADSCMMGCCAHALLEDLLKTIPDFYSDFRNFTDCESIRDMLNYYQLASSNHNGMLHCTAKYFGKYPPASSYNYYEKVKTNVTKSFETVVIGIVITPRTFGARLKLSTEQLNLWGGDDEEVVCPPSDEMVDQLPFENLSINQSSEIATSEDGCHLKCREPLSSKVRSPRYFPNCQASLVYSTAKAAKDPDFHPVTGPGCKAHMTLGVARNVSAVTTGYDLLEIVKLEKESKKWPTYESQRGWLRNYGKGRWVLYMKTKITMGSLFAGVYDFQ